MLVIFVLPDLPLSGAATRTVHLVGRLVGIGVRVAVCVLIDRVAAPLAADLRGTGSELLRMTSAPDRRRLSRLLRTTGPVVVHAAMPTAGAVGLLIGRWAGHAVVYSVTNCLHADRPLRRFSLRDQIKSGLERLLIAQADAVHAVSTPIRDQIVDRHPAIGDRLHTVVHPPTPPIGSAGVAPVIDRASPRLLTIARLLDHKRIEDAVHATALLRVRWPHVHLVVLGDGPGQATLRATVDRAGLTGSVSFLGECATPAVFLGWADVLVHPSLYEGFPRVVAEALAWRTPVVCVGGAHAPTAPGIWYARPFDPHSLARAVLDVLEATHDEVPCVEPSSAIARAMKSVYCHALRTAGRLRRQPDNHPEQTAGADEHSRAPARTSESAGRTPRRRGARRPSTP